jgi:chorismate mutase
MGAMNSRLSVQEKLNNFFQAPLEELLVGLDERSGDIVRRRFGLEAGRRETLESIGQEYSITRERVRQIEAQAKKLLRERLEVAKEVAELLEKIFREHGGLLTEQQVVEVVKTEGANEKILAALISFYLELLPPYEYRAHDALFVAHWRHPELVAPVVSEVAKAGRKILTVCKVPTQENEFVNQVCLSLELPSDKEKQIKTWLKASRHMLRNPFGEWGLAGWAEMTPRGVGDKAYAVLRRHGKPEHFREIARMINEAKFDRKVANPQTVHNELIKDERFVLVGRGLYGLTQWGYVPGTVADVIAAVLKQTKKSLSREEVISKVLEQRMVKKNTILLSLQDQSRFVKTAENSYTLR